MDPVRDLARSRRAASVWVSPPPDPAGLRRAQWRILLATSFCYLFYYTGRQNFGWAIKGIREDVGLSNTEIGWISGTALVFYGVGQVVSGQLSDRFGGRQMVTIGAILSCLFNWLTSFGHGFWTLIVPWSANNAAQSMGFAPGSRLIADWWSREERGKAFGIFTFAAGFASVLTFACAILVLERLSWIWVFRLPVLSMPLAGLAFYALTRDRQGERGVRSPGHAVRADPGGGGRQPSFLEGWREVLANRRFLVGCLGFGFTNWGRLGLLVWVPTHFLGAGWKADPSAAWVTLSLPVGMALGALVAGYGADRYFHADHPRLIALLLVLASVTSLAIAFVPRDHRALGMGLLFLAGFFVFGPFSSFTALSAELLDRGSTGTGVGVMNAAGYAVAALGDPVIGAVLDATRRTESLFFITAAACLGGAVCSFAIRAARDPVGGRNVLR